MTATPAAGPPAGSNRWRPVPVIAAVLALAGAPALASPPPRAAQPSPAPVGTAPTAEPGPVGPPTRGELLYEANCASCHGPAGAGTQRGPSLHGAGAASAHFQLSTGRMPLADEDNDPRRGEPAFPPEDIAALVDYVAGFPGDGPPVPVVRAGDVDRGRVLYTAYCAACHSATGFGGALTNGRWAPELDEATPVQVAEAVRVGPGMMPAFPSDVFTDAEVDALAAYVDVLQDDRFELDRGGLPLWRIGPFAEGLVAWVVGLVALVLLARWLGSRAR